MNTIYVVRQWAVSIRVMNKYILNLSTYLCVYVFQPAVKRASVNLTLFTFFPGPAADSLVASPPRTLAQTWGSANNSTAAHLGCENRNTLVPRLPGSQELALFSLPSKQRTHFCAVTRKLAHQLQQICQQLCPIFRLSIVFFCWFCWTLLCQRHVPCVSFSLLL